jgi:hypothetical protein
MEDLNGNDIAGLIRDAGALEVKLKVAHLFLALLSCQPLVSHNARHEWMPSARYCRSAFFLRTHV